MNPTLAKYSPALLALVIALTGAVSQLTGRLTLVGALQLAVLAANAFLVYLVPTFGPGARSLWKVGVAVLGAIVAAAIPFATAHHITAQQVALVILAGLQALSAHVGVDIRRDATTYAVTSTAVASPVPAASEPPTDTTMQKAIQTTGGEFIGDPAR